MRDRHTTAVHEAESDLLFTRDEQAYEIPRIKPRRVVRLHRSNAAVRN